MRRPKKQSLIIDNPTIGADIEIFLKDTNTDLVISAEGIIKGTKTEPYFFVPDNPYFATSLDNVMAEFCIPPVTSGVDFHKNIMRAVAWIQSQLPIGVTTKFSPAERVLAKYLMSENAKKFGCDPDSNAWELGIINDVVDPEAIGNLRSCGGHVHVGYDKPDATFNMELVRWMDIFVGMPSILQEPDNERKSLYGKAGAFRNKPYGVEYRTISNYYINSKVLTEWVFQNTHFAIDAVNNRRPLTREEGNAVVLSINNNDKQLAKTMCDYFGVKLAA